MFQVVPLANGPLALTVTDLCLWTRHPASAQVSVVGLSRIDMQVADKIEQGSTVTMSVHLYDTQGAPLTDSAVLPLLALKPLLGSDIVRVSAAAAAAESPQYTVLGASLGDTTLSFVSGDVRSSVISVQVFAPLRLSPRNVTLVVGATVQVVSSGGPQPDAVVEYSLDDASVAACSLDGMVSAVRLGRSKLWARAVGTDRQTGQSVVYSEDRVDVHVVSLAGVRITLPLNRVRQNSEMPVHLVGLDSDGGEQTPFSFATCWPPLDFYWSLSDSQSAQLCSPWAGSGLDACHNEPSAHSAHMNVRFRALQPGHTVLRVRVASRPAHHQQQQQQQQQQFDGGVDELVDEVSIQVYESLQLTTPEPTHGDVIVLMPNTDFHVRTNLDSSAVAVDYVIHGTAGTPSDLVRLDANRPGVISAGTLLGQTSLVVRAKNNYGVTQSVSSLVEVTIHLPIQFN